MALVAHICSNSYIFANQFDPNTMTGQKKSTTLLLLCLIAGTLDALAAILLSWKHPASGVFKYIASGWFGMAAFKGGTGNGSLGSSIPLPHRLNSQLRIFLFISRF